MKTVVFHLQAKTCEKDISKLKEEILSYNIRIEEKELSEVKEEKDVECYKRATEELQSYGREREGARHEQRAG